MCLLAAELNRFENGEVLPSEGNPLRKEQELRVHEPVRTPADGRRHIRTLSTPFIPTGRGLLTLLENHQDIRNGTKTY